MPDGKINKKKSPLSLICCQDLKVEITGAKGREDELQIEIQLEEDPLLEKYTTEDIKRKGTLMEVD